MKSLKKFKWYWLLIATPIVVLTTTSVVSCSANMQVPTSVYEPSDEARQLLSFENFAKFRDKLNEVYKGSNFNCSCSVKGNDLILYVNDGKEYTEDVFSLVPDPEETKKAGKNMYKHIGKSNGQIDPNYTTYLDEEQLKNALTSIVNPGSTPIII